MTERKYTHDEIRRQMKVCGSEITAAMMAQLLEETEALQIELANQCAQRYETACELERVIKEREEAREALKRHVQADTVLYNMPLDCEKDHHVAALEEHDSAYAASRELLATLFVSGKE